MSSQGWLWPTLKHALYEDLKKVHATTGDWDVVIFSGDLTQRGSRSEFDELDRILAELWANFRAWGFSPALLTIPGNHDIIRPSPNEPEILLLNRWWDEQPVREHFFSEPTSRYRQAIDRCFAEYQAWVNRLPSTGIPTAPVAAGILPGDHSAVVAIRERRVGIVGLNSTWLQLGPADYRAKLHVDARQLLRVTDNDPVKWCEANAFNVLVTHQPLDWLHTDSQAVWNSDINPSGRFDVHLFGHMHEAASASMSTAGSAARTSIQAASLFGLEQVGDTINSRIHGYSVAQLRVTGDHSELRVWPRRLRTLIGGDRKLGPDLGFDLAEDNSYSAFVRGPKEPSTRPVMPGSRQDTVASVRMLPSSGASEGALRKVRYHLSASRAHLDVRAVEQKKCLAAISEARAIWIVAEWGMSADGFVWSVQSHRGETGSPTYRLDLSEYEGREQFLESIKRVLECSFERLCELLSNAGRSYLLLDDILTGPPSQQGALSHEQDIEDLLQVILEYCPELVVVLRARRAPESSSLSLVELKALDEADLRVYVSRHERGGPQLTTPEAINVLYRHTDGVPTRVDTALKDLEVVSLSELASTNSDLATTAAAADDAPAALVRAIQDLAEATDPTLRRSYELLKVLTLFPQGEQLSRIKRFHGPHPFFTAHARELVDRALVDASVVQAVDLGGRDAPAKTLVVPRPIREYVRKRVKNSELRSLSSRAAELYFGQGWSAGAIKSPSGYRFDNPHRSSADISNASTIVLRLLGEARRSENQRATAAALGIASRYIESLISGNHYWSVVTLCDDLLPLLPEDGYEERRAYLKYAFGRGLRMVGDVARAKTTILEVAGFDFPKATRQGVMLHLALCHQSLNETEEALEAARQTVRIDKHSHAGLQARGIIVELATDDPNREQKLIDIEALCRRRKAHIAANNIALLRAREAKDNPAKAQSILAVVVGTADATNDFYNGTRAILRATELAMRSGQHLRDADRSRLIEAYHFLFNERMSTLFDQCHDALWQAFSISSDTNNLLSLFRHSSFFWRLRGREDKERKYLRELAKVGRGLSEDVRSLDREAAYYLVRASSALTQT